MTKVVLSGSLKAKAGGSPELEVEARTIRELLSVLEERFPRLADDLEQGVAVSIDGQIFRDDWTQAIPATAEVFLIPRIEGG